jgi:hypothetical protein
MKTKLCVTCNQSKPLEDFGKCARCKDGVRGDCKKCFSEKQIARDLKNHKMKKKYLKQWNKKKQRPCGKV